MKLNLIKIGLIVLIFPILLNMMVNSFSGISFIWPFVGLLILDILILVQINEYQKYENYNLYDHVFVGTLLFLVVNVYYGFASISDKTYSAIGEEIGTGPHGRFASHTVYYAVSVIHLLGLMFLYLFRRVEVEDYERRKLLFQIIMVLAAIGQLFLWANFHFL